MKSLTRRWHLRRITGTYVARYAQEAGWRDDRRREPNGSQVRLVGSERRTATPAATTAATYAEKAAANMGSPFGRSAGIGPAS